MVESSIFIGGDMHILYPFASCVLPFLVMMMSIVQYHENIYSNTVP